MDRGGERERAKSQVAEKREPWGVGNISGSGSGSERKGKKRERMGMGMGMDRKGKLEINFFVLNRRWYFILGSLSVDLLESTSTLTLPSLIEEPPLSAAE